MQKHQKYPYIQIILCLLFWIPMAANAMTCYTILNKSEKVIFQSASAPVDMSQTVISQAVQNKFGADAFMIFNENPVCAEIVANIDVNTTNTNIQTSGQPKNDFFDRIPDVTESKSSANAGSGSASETIHTGKRGGQFYFNKNGNKQYINPRR